MCQAPLNFSLKSTATCSCRDSREALAEALAEGGSLQEATLLAPELLADVHADTPRRMWTRKGR
eukprot:6286703-Amphidinium_carterae.1